MTYEEFKQKATNPTHRDIPSIFKVRMILMGGPVEGKKQLYPKYTTNDYASGFATTLAEAEAMVRKDVAWWKAQEYCPGVFCYFITEKPMNMMASTARFCRKGHTMRKANSSTVLSAPLHSAITPTTTTIIQERCNQTRFSVGDLRKKSNFIRATSLRY